MGQQPLLTRREAAAILRLHPRTLTAWAATGYGPAPAHIGHRVFYAHADVQSWIERQLEEGHEAHAERHAAWLELPEAEEWGEE